MNTLRSVSRYVSLALGDDFEVRLARDERAGLERPWALVTEATPIISTAHGPRVAVRRQSFAISALPLPGINAESSLTEAMRIKLILLEAFTGGLDEKLFSHRSDRRHPMRVPLFDYTGVALYEPATEDRRAGTARVIEQPSVEAFPDPADDLLYTVACVVRLQWTESVTRDPGWRTVEEVRLRAEEDAA